MLHTIEEAKAKYCCCKMYANGLRNCLANECMGWQWFDSAKTKGYCGMVTA